jgi:hypothetical protein
MANALDSLLIINGEIGANDLKAINVQIDFRLRAVHEEAINFKHKDVHWKLRISCREFLSGTRQESIS